MTEPRGHHTVAREDLFFSVKMALLKARNLWLLLRQERLGGIELLDGRGLYTPGEAAALFEALDRLDANVRAVYAATGLTIDMAFPTTYGMLLFRLFPAPFCLLPLVATAAADALENRPSRRWR